MDGHETGGVVPSVRWCVVDCVRAAVECMPELCCRLRGARVSVQVAVKQLCGKCLTRAWAINLHGCVRCVYQCLVVWREVRWEGVVLFVFVMCGYVDCCWCCVCWVCAVGVYVFVVDLQCPP